MNVLKFSDKDFAARLDQVAAASSLFDPVVEERAHGIVDAVRTRGDAALLEFTARFDGAQITAEQLAVTTEELFNASVAADDSLRAAVKAAEKNIAAFAKNPSAATGPRATRTARPLARSSMASGAWASTSPAAPRRSSPRR